MLGFYPMLLMRFSKRGSNLTLTKGLASFDRDERNDEDR